MQFTIYAKHKNLFYKAIFYSYFSLESTHATLPNIVYMDYMPHFPSIQKKPLSCFASLNHYDGCIIKPTHQLLRKLVIDEWPNLLHVYASILQNETDQSVIIRKLASHQYYSRTQTALWKYDSIFRNIYMLNYIDDITLRQSVRKSLNRGESYHQLYKAIASLNGGRFREKTEAEIEVWSECTRLVASVIIYYNAHILSLLLEKAETDEERELITQVSPVAWAHLNFLGKYEFDPQKEPLDIEKWIKNIDLNLAKLQT